MNRQKKCLVGLITVLITLLLIGGNKQAQSQSKYPTRAIDIIVPFGPGGGTDLVMRVLAANMKNKWGVPVNVVNKPGGNTVPACLEVFKSKPDGYILLADSTPSATMLPVIIKDLPFKIMDRTFVASVSIFNLVMMVPSTSPIKSLKELAEMAKKDPGKFTWNSGGGASNFDYGARQFFKAIGVDVSKTKPVLAKSGAETMALLGGGHITMGNTSPAPAIPLIKAGLVRPLATTANKRDPDLPDVPTTAELGFPTVTDGQWSGISGPPNMPSHIVEAWNKTLAELMKDPEMISQLRKAGSNVFYLNAIEMKEHIVKEIKEIEELMGMK